MIRGFTPAPLTASEVSMWAMKPTAGAVFPSGRLAGIDAYT